MFVGWTRSPTPCNPAFGWSQYKLCSSGWVCRLWGPSPGPLLLGTVPMGCSFVAGVVTHLCLNELLVLPQRVLKTPELSHTLKKRAPTSPPQ